MGFKGIVGHEDIIAHFKSSIETGNVAHAYIISGDAGSGKKALAYAFAETLECEAGGTEACGTCQSCLQVSIKVSDTFLFICFLILYPFVICYYKRNNTVAILK